MSQHDVVCPPFSGLLQLSLAVPGIVSELIDATRVCVRVRASVRLHQKESLSHQLPYCKFRFLDNLSIRSVSVLIQLWCCMSVGNCNSLKICATKGPSKRPCNFLHIVHMTWLSMMHSVIMSDGSTDFFLSTINLGIKTPSYWRRMFYLCLQQALVTPLWIPILHTS